MKNNRYAPILVVILALISFLCLSFGVSYSYVTRSRVNANAVVVTTSDLTSSATISSASFTLTSMTDEDGLAQGSEYAAKISFSKNNVYSVFYRINVGYSTASIPTGYSTSDLIPLEYIRVALYTMSGDVISSEPIVGPVSIADLPLSYVDSSNIFNSTYFLDYGTFATGSASAKYALKLWIDIDTPEKYDDKIVYIGVTTTSETKVSKSFFNISGTVVDSSGTAVSGAKVSFHNNKITSTTASTGAYTLNNVPSGTYTISVTYNGVEYKTPVYIQGGAANAVLKLGDVSAAAGTYLPSVALTNYSTPGFILDNTSLTTTSVQAAGAAYTVPGSYKITGIDSLTTQSLNLKLTLNSDGKTLGIALA
ncbi:MAG: carboxypeptidase regulatory-like domain-containing protein [Bacilli bacterium]|nr:carboxypeptidase regulatory-like domain-containing protein [Bacilli bacterium]